MPDPFYKRVLLKLSGEALAGDQGYGIDPKTIADIQSIVRDLRDQNIGILVTDHNVDQTLKITDRAYVIWDGKVFAHGTPAEIVSNAEVQDRYLGKGYDARGIIGKAA